MWTVPFRASEVPKLREHLGSSVKGAFCEAAGFPQECRADPPWFWAFWDEELVQKGQVRSPFLHRLSLSPMTAVRTITNPVTSRHRNLSSYSSEGQKSQISLMRLKSRCCQGWFLQEVPGRIHPLPFPAAFPGCQHSLACGCLTSMTFPPVMLLSPFL